MSTFGFSVRMALAFLAFCVLFSVSALGQEILLEPRESLEGLSGVSIIIEPLPIGAEARGLKTDSLRHLVHRLLDEAGIPVLSEEERLLSRRAPVLYVQITLKAFGSQHGVYAFNVQVALEQLVVLREERQGEEGRRRLAYAFTWQQNATGAVDIDKVAQLEDVVVDMTRLFIDDCSIGKVK